MLVLAVAWSLDASAQRTGAEGPFATETPSSNATCPPDTWPFAAPNYDYTTKVSGTLLCNTTWPKSQCPCKKCETIPFGYSSNIFSHLYPPLGTKKKYTYNDYNDAEKWVTDNSCGKAPVVEPQPPTPHQSPEPPPPPRFVRPALDAGDQNDCELLSSTMDPALKAACEANIQKAISNAGKCSDYFEKRAQQGGQGYDGGGQAHLNEQDKPRICEFLVASDALSAEQRAAMAKSQAIDRRLPSEQDVEACRSIVEQDAKENRYCFNQLNKLIRGPGKCGYYYGARFRQGETCPLPGQRMNTFAPKSTPAGAPASVR